jgi:hypothetical protein
MGSPLRVVISPRCLASGQAEVQSRDKSLQTTVAMDELILFLQKTIKGEMEKLNK